ncbi:MAG: hypothetical protein IKP64_00420 [Selenomonadaceae bacterium]|nr:hypothetical protein [Selenomonadaceae bacterium]MBR4382000.1 hypothetical protein [Selenomonadaceae bacterium]
MAQSFSLIPFKNKNFGKIRGLLINGEPWFVAADVCNVLEKRCGASKTMS